MRYPCDKFTINEGYTNHPPAADIAAPAGTTIKSPMAGTVIDVINNNSGYFGGKYIIVRENTKYGYEHYMGHNSINYAKVGQKVKEGQKLGKVGSTGQASGPHVHYQIRQRYGGGEVNVKNLYKKRLKFVKMDKPGRYKLVTPSSKLNLVHRTRYKTVYPKGKVVYVVDKVVEKNGKTYLRTRVDKLARRSAVFERSKLRRA